MYHIQTNRHSSTCKGETTLTSIHNIFFVVFFAFLRSRGYLQIQSILCVWWIVVYFCEFLKILVNCVSPMSTGTDADASMEIEMDTNVEKWKKWKKWSKHYAYTTCLTLWTIETRRLFHIHWMSVGSFIMSVNLYVYVNIVPSWGNTIVCPCFRRFLFGPVFFRLWWNPRVALKLKVERNSVVLSKMLIFEYSIPPKNPYTAKQCVYVDHN